MSATTTQGLGEISEVAPTGAWANEVLFSFWLANNLGKLEEVLGLDALELIGTEQPVGTFRCDIVARESEAGSNRTVVIENQFTRTDHDHLGKLLAYAAHHNAQVIRPRLSNVALEAEQAGLITAAEQETRESLNVP